MANLPSSEERFYLARGLPYTSFSDIIPKVDTPKKEEQEKPKLKIIKETDEVTRLNNQPTETSPPRKKVQLRRTNESKALSKSLESEDETELASENLEPEDFSTVNAAPLQIPPIVFVLVGGAFLLLLALGIFMALGGRRDNPNIKEDRAKARITQSIQERKEARNIVDTITETINKYTAAATIEEKAAFIRHPKRVTPLMQEYYQRYDLETLSGAKLLNQSTFPIKSHSFLIAFVSFDNGDKKNFLLEIDFDGKVRIDWESEVCYNPIDPPQFVADKPTESQLLRVYAIPDNYYVYEFSDESKYQCFRLTFRDHEEALYGYAERGTPIEKILHTLFTQIRQTGVNSPQPLTLKARYLPDSRSTNGILIEEIIANRWALLDEFDDEN